MSTARPPLSPHQHLARQIAVAAETDPRVVARYVAGARVRSTTAARIERALRELGLEHLRPAAEAAP